MVNVLAAMDEVLSARTGLDTLEYEALAVARDAVRELTEAAKELHLVTLPYGDGRDNSAEVRAARARICFALGNCGAFS
jgi:hypothetical protein